MPTAAVHSRRRPWIESLAVATVVLLLVIGGVLTFWDFRQLEKNRARVRQTNAVLLALEATESAIKDAETGQRGFIITGREPYLQPFDGAMRHVDQLLAQLDELTADLGDQQDRLLVLEALIARRVAELRVAIEQRRTGGLEAGKAAVDTDIGLRTMDSIRRLTQEMRQTEYDRLLERKAIAAASDRNGKIMAVLLTMVGLSLVGGVIHLNHRNRVRAEKAAAYTGSILDGLSEMVIVLDDALTISTLNASTTSSFRLGEAPPIGQSIYQFADGALDVPAVRGLIAQVHLGEARSSQAVLERDFAHVGFRVLRMTAHRFDPTFSQRGSVLLVISDVTEEREIESKHKRLDQHMRWFLEQLHDYAIFTMDAQCRATSWNRGVQEVLGYREDEFIGCDVRNMIFTPESIADGSADEEFVTAARDGQANDDRWMVRRGGVRFWASGVTHSIVDDHGRLVGFSKLMRDLTSRKQAQDELADLASQLSESDRRKNEFLATLAHELRNPLAPIKNAVQLMAMTPLGSETECLRQTMARQIEQMVRLIDDLLDVSRISRGKISLQRQVVELRSIIDAAVEASSAFISESGQELKVQIPDEPVHVDADPSRLTQVISNLLNNSAKYSNADCHIELRVNVVDDHAIIEVHDDGIGIEADKLEEIFEMFSQVDQSLQRGSAGLGIGLTLVKTLLELHGGSITAHSDGPGRGSRFTVRLPLADSVSLSESLSPRSSERSHPTRCFRILLVEDQRALRVVLSQLLQKMGHEVQAAESGTAAIELLDDYTPEIIFSDISMPGMTGYELIRRLRERRDMVGVAMVAMTGYGQATDREKAMQCGFDEHMVKPVDVSLLQDFFARWESQNDFRGREPSTPAVDRLSVGIS